MYVIKRSQRRENVMFDKITTRVRKLCEGLDSDFVDPVEVTMRVNQGIYAGVTTVELDLLAAETCAFMSTNHPDYSILAARICLSNLYKETESCYKTLVQKMREYVNPETSQHAPLVSEELASVVANNSKVIQEALDEVLENYDYFAFKTLEKSYLLKMDGRVSERPHQLLMRVAIGIHGHDMPNVLRAFRDMRDKRYTMATPTLFNAGTPVPQMSSCFLMTNKADSISGIFDSLKDCATISKYAGGIGISVHDVRARGSYIRGTNGTSNGLVPMLRVFNNAARYVDQGGGRRKGSFAVYLEPWHADVQAFIDLRKNHGNDLERARDLFYALWVPDLFMKRVEKNSAWSLFCPNECPGLSDVCGSRFEDLYARYESQGKARKVMDARKLWDQIVDVQVETGTPYILFKDSVNAKSNQQHLGVIKSSNLCTEIVEYTSPDEIAVCNLGSINLSTFVRDAYTSTASFDLEELVNFAGRMVLNLNRVIDKNFYPVPEAENSNLKHRPIGIGVQGFADALVMMRLPYDSVDAAGLNLNIFESIYYGAMKQSVHLARSDGGPHESFRGSPLEQGIFQFDLWGVKPSGLYDWEALRADVIKHGVKNALLVAPMPTASTAQILGNNESFEPFTSNVYNRRVLAGEFPVINKHLLRDLTSLGVWGDKVKNQLLRANGSVQNIPQIPEDIKALYKTVWEIPQRVILDHAAARGPFICQSQSMNIHMAEPSRGKITSMLFYGWRKGLKTGMYYLRTRPKADSIQFALEKSVKNHEEDTCLTCSS
ncbi:putative ribonucleotide reductase large subunit [Feldmannia species virus]|uniref:Ribonucleoside-diphosphate reductase n=1 Tax=Feldmannia species virus TaxID=39420 RepID=B5LWI5_9PHYC|nr:ribonucleotide reductase [Feldmannia species virus]ACH46848.1 putative ribonucleotide reductase large subunit [Feldmannia species virus]